MTDREDLLSICGNAKPQSDYVRDAESVAAVNEWAGTVVSTLRPRLGLMETKGRNVDGGRGIVELISRMDPERPLVLYHLIGDPHCWVYVDATTCTLIGYWRSL